MSKKWRQLFAEIRDAMTIDEAREFWDLTRAHKLALDTLPSRHLGFPSRHLGFPSGRWHVGEEKRKPKKGDGWFAQGMEIVRDYPPIKKRYDLEGRVYEIDRKKNVQL